MEHILTRLSISELSRFNLVELRGLDESTLITTDDGKEFLVVIIPYEQFIKMQKKFIETQNLLEYFTNESRNPIPRIGSNPF